MHFEELVSWVRHQKYKKLKEALEQVPNKPFDQSITKVQFVQGHGTAYLEHYEREGFNLNKTDEHGNTLLHISAQNGNIRVAKLLFSKGANPNHQNNAGQTAGHFAIAYQFYDFTSWLFDPEQAGGDDLLLNIYGLGAYDGLAGGGEEEEEEEGGEEDA